MRYGYWLPIFGGWLRNVEDEGMTPTWEYASKVAMRAEQIGFSLTLVAELNLNDIKGVDAPSLDAWSTAAALAAVTRTQEIMVAVRPTFHGPALLAKQAANIDNIAGGRLSLNVVSSWWADEAKKYGVAFEKHDDRYARTAEWLEVVDSLWQRDHVTFSGRYYRVEDTILQPKPVAQPRPPLYAGGESEAAREMIARQCDGYVMHGDSPELIGARIDDMRARRVRMGLPPKPKPSGRVSRMSTGARRATITTSNGLPGRSWSSAFRSKTTRSPIVVCARGWSGRPPRSRRGFARSRRSASISCCCNARRSWKRWSDSPRR